MKFENHRYYNCEITLDNGEKYQISANWMHNNDLDHWKGWNCDAGYRRLDIDKNFDVYSAQCKNELLGNLFNEWSMYDSPSKCLRERCTGCTDDLLIGKQQSSKAESI